VRCNQTLIVQTAHTDTFLRSN